MLTIDRECDGWQCDIGMVPTVLERMHPDPANTIAITCGPPIMIKFALLAFEKLGFTPEQTYTTLEKTHEVRHRDLRPLQHRAEVCLCGWAGVFAGGIEWAAG